jgi:RHS repeat-associated protein
MYDWSPQHAPSAYKFTGKERDSESNLDYFGATMGRFMSADPKMITAKGMVDPQQWNMYLYVRNNPLSYVDPDGKELKKGNNSYTREGFMRAVNDIHKAGVKNVTVEFRSGSPDAKTLSGLNKDSHNTVFRVQDSSEKSLAAKATEKVLGGTTIGQAEITTNVVHVYPNGSGAESMETREISNVAKHEELHQAGESFLSDFTPKEGGNVMDPKSHDRDLEFKDLQINPHRLRSSARNLIVLMKPTPIHMGQRAWVAAHHRIKEYPQ